MPMKQDRRGYGSAGSGTTSLAKGPKDFFRLGTWSARCDQCYLKCKADEMFLRWDNCRVCYRCIEIRNPQDFVQGVPDDMGVPWSRPTPPPQFATGDGDPATESNNDLVDAQEGGQSMPG